MNEHNIQMFMFLIILFISINTTNGVINIPSITFHNRSLSNQMTTLYPWKKSNSIEMLKKLIANRHNLTKTNRTLLLTSKVHLLIRRPLEMSRI
jgi:hypothetical protein